MFLKQEVDDFNDFCFFLRKGDRCNGQFFLEVYKLMLSMLSRECGIRKFLGGVYFDMLEDVYQYREIIRWGQWVIMEGKGQLQLVVGENVRRWIWSYYRS